MIVLLSAYTSPQLCRYSAIRCVAFLFLFIRILTVKMRSSGIIFPLYECVCVSNEKAQAF